MQAAVPAGQWPALSLRVGAKRAAPLKPSVSLLPHSEALNEERAKRQELQEAMQQVCYRSLQRSLRFCLLVSAP